MQGKMYLLSVKKETLIDYCSSFWAHFFETNTGIPTPKVPCIWHCFQYLECIIIFLIADKHDKRSKNFYKFQIWCCNVIPLLFLVFQ